MGRRLHGGYSQTPSSGLLHGWQVWDKAQGSGFDNDFTSWGPSADAIVHGTGLVITSNWNSTTDAVDAGGVGEPTADALGGSTYTEPYGLYMWCESTNATSSTDYLDEDALIWPVDNMWPQEGEIDANEYTPHYNYGSGSTEGENSTFNIHFYGQYCPYGNPPPSGDTNDGNCAYNTNVTFDHAFVQPPGGWDVFALEWASTYASLLECDTIRSGLCTDWVTVESITTSDTVTAGSGSSAVTYDVSMPSTAMQFDFEAQAFQSSSGTSDDVLDIPWFYEYQEQSCCAE